MATGTFVNATVATEDTALASAPAPFLVSVAEGGTGATTAAAARTNLGILDYIYPVGSIYMSTANVNPATLFGGTWEQLEDRFLLGAGGNYTVGDTGGEAEHTLTDDELPTTNGSFKLRRMSWGTGTSQSASMVSAPSGIVTGVQTVGSGADTVSYYSGVQRGQDEVTIGFGSDTAHNNMPPYLAVYMWERTA